MKVRSIDAGGRPVRSNIFRRFAAGRQGSTAVEFGMLAIPFCLLVFAILESCISFAGQQVMANAADDVARRIRTGQIDGDTLDEAKLRQLICNEMQILVAASCPGLEVDLREFDTFAEAATLRIKYTAGDKYSRDLDTSEFDVSVGDAMTKNTLRVFYRWPVMTDIMRRSMSTIKDGKTLHFASVTWQNEPFE